MLFGVLVRHPRLRSQSKATLSACLARTTLVIKFTYASRSSLVANGLVHRLSNLYLVPVFAPPQAEMCLLTSPFFRAIHRLGAIVTY